MVDIRNFVKSVVRSVIKTEYPHARRPGSVLAKITNAEHMDDSLQRYTLRILDKAGNEDGQMPEIPNVISDRYYQEGNIVVIQYVNGLYPYISGRWYV